MAAPLDLRYLFWALTTLLEFALLLLLVRRKLYLSHPAFLVYISAAIVQSGVMAFSYKYLETVPLYNVAWCAQAAVICARWCAVVEITRKTLADYKGIWTLASSILFFLGISILVYATVFSKDLWTLGVLNADRSVELCIATFIVCMLLFVRYYRLPMSNLERMLAIGFCLYSCFCVINDSIYENWIHRAGPLWTYLDMLTFFASLLLWLDAVRKYSESPNLATSDSLRPELYGQLSQKLNTRLQVLNNRLEHLFRSEDSHS